MITRNSAGQLVVHKKVFYTLCGLVFLMLVVLKLTGVLDWSWWVFVVLFFVPPLIMGTLVAFAERKQ